MNGIDRVFVSALNTVKRLPSSPSSPKPPLEDRLLLYGLFKQSMEGDVPGSMLQTLQGEPVDDEDDANREKTLAWAEQRGTSKTEAKKLYITTLIRSMRQYGSKTETARSLIDELEFVWNQVIGNNEDDETPLHSRSNSGSRVEGRQSAHQYVGDDEVDEDDVPEGQGYDDDDRPEGGEEELARAQPRVYRTAQNSPSKAMQPQRTGDGRFLNPSALLLGAGGGGTRGISLPTSADDEKWKRQVEVALQQIRAELASVRESLLHSPRSSSPLFGASGSRHSFLSATLARVYGFVNVSLTVLVYDAVFLGVVWYVFRRRGDARAKRVEVWFRSLWDWLMTKARVRVRTGVRSITDRR